MSGSVKLAAITNGSLCILYETGEQYSVCVCVRVLYLWTTGKEGFDVDVGVMHFQVMIAKAPSYTDGSQHTCLNGEHTCGKQM